MDEALFVLLSLNHSIAIYPAYDPAYERLEPEVKAFLIEMRSAGAKSHGSFPRYSAPANYPHTGEIPLMLSPVAEGVSYSNCVK